MRAIFISLLICCVSTFASANCEKKLFSFTVKNSDAQSIKIIDLLENVSDECKISLVLEDNSVKDSLNKKLDYLYVSDFTLIDLFDLILSENNIFYTLSNNGKVLKVANFKTKSYFIDYVSFTERKSTTNKVIKTGSSGEGEDSTTMDFSSEFKFWEKIEDEIKEILYRDEDTHEIKAKVLINQEAGMLTVTGTKKQLHRVQNYLKALMKRMHKEILIEAKILEVTYSNENTTGIDWSKFDLGINVKSDALRSRGTTSTGAVSQQAYSAISDGFLNTFRHPNYMVGYSFSMEGLLKFLKTQGDVSVVSSPKVMTLNNQPAVINVGTELNYRYDTGSTTSTSNGTTTTTPSYETDSTFVGITLDVTPQVTENDYIILKINPIISAVETEHVDAAGVPYLAPDINIKQLSSIVKVKNENKVLIGGLISHSDTINDTSVPGLSAIPLLGEAFKSSGKEIKKSELIIVITPHIVNGTSTPNLSDLEKKLYPNSN